MRKDWPVACIGLAMALAGCDRARPPEVAPRLVVCATSFALADVARQVGGAGVKIDWIIDLGDPIDRITLNASERQRFSTVDFALCDGGRTEPWAQQELVSIRDTERLLSLDALPIATTTPRTGILWLDPMVVRQFVPRMVEQFTYRAPRRREEFLAGGNRFIAALDALVARYPNAAFGRGRVLVTSPMFVPLLDRFGVRYVLAEADPLDFTDTAASGLAAAARNEGIHALLLPFDTPAGAVADIEQRTGTKAYLLDPIGYPNYPEHGDYLSILRFNLDQLKAATSLHE